MKSYSKSNLDSLGICTSSLCAIHCLVTPFVILLFPFAGLAFLEGESFEISILIISIILAALSLVRSYFKNHKNILPLTLALSGFVFLGFSKIFTLEFSEITLSVIGGMLVVLAHLKNRKLLQQSKAI